MRSTNHALGIVTTLSKASAQGSGIPSASSSATSVGIPLTRRVAGTAITALSTGIAA